MVAFDLSDFAKSRPRVGGRFVKQNEVVENAIKSISKTIDCPDCLKDKKTGRSSGLKDYQTLCPTCKGSGTV